MQGPFENARITGSFVVERRSSVQEEIEKIINMQAPDSSRQGSLFSQTLYAQSKEEAVKRVKGLRKARKPRNWLKMAATIDQALTSDPMN